MRSIDLNADTGEADRDDWRAIEAAVFPFITSANIACGGHAGDEISMRRTVRLARSHQINMGAHPSYPDRDNFGRKSMRLGQDIERTALQKTLLSQITKLCEIASKEDSKINYVKPHGALYNDAVFDAALAVLLAETVALLDNNLWIMGAPNSELEQAAKHVGLSFIAEGFVDRCYTDDGHLLSRSIEGAVIEDQQSRCEQALGLLTNGKVNTYSGGSLELSVNTLCLHSDSPGADITAASIRNALETAGATIESFIHAG